MEAAGVEDAGRGCRLRPGVFLSFSAAARGIDSIDRTGRVGRLCLALEQSTAANPGAGAGMDRLLFVRLSRAAVRRDYGMATEHSRRGRVGKRRRPGTRAAVTGRLRGRAQGGEVSAWSGAFFGGTCEPGVVAPPAWEAYKAGRPFRQLVSALA